MIKVIYAKTILMVSVNIDQIRIAELMINFFILYFHLGKINLVMYLKYYCYL